MITHIYLKFENFDLQSNNLVHKGVDFYAQNALKLTYTSIFNPNIFRGYTPGPSLKRREEGEKRGREN